jgi:NAD-dependent deacetylase
VVAPREKVFRVAAETIKDRRHTVALTGAGISVDSGIPMFRGTQGMWEKYDPMEYATIGAFLRNPEKVWMMLAEMVEVLFRAVPNPAHSGLAELEKMGLLRSIITQNVDGLHQAAGSQRVIEFHGNAWELICISCWNRYPSREKIQDGIPPRCECGRILKPNLVLFGEAIPWKAQEDAESEAETCSVLLVIGTSAQVAPACDIPRLSKRKGAAIIEINPEATPLTRTITDLYIPENAGYAISRLLGGIRDFPPPS